MSPKQILVIEDETDIREMLALRLKKERFQVLEASEGMTGLKKAQEEQPDLVLLDLMLPFMNGLDILRKLRENRKTAQLPIIIVSAKGEESDVIVGLELGADDYVTKPFNMSVLLARINALLRRFQTSEAPAKIVSVGSVEIDSDRFLVTVDGEPISLTRTEFGILYALATSKGRVLTRNQLIDEAIGSDALVTDRTIDVHITSLRGKLGEARELVETVRGIGYRLAAVED
ncbi:MAG: response regulator transcription factor [Planctomycetaceae bacterium]|nr:response regulator transcription factor [Planctomycetaceae bacterium]